MIVEGQEEFFRAPFYIDVEEYFELQRRVNKKRKGSDAKISVDRKPSGTLIAQG